MSAHESPILAIVSIALSTSTAKHTSDQTHRPLTYAQASELMNTLYRTIVCLP